MDIICPHCGAKLEVRGDAVIHTCDYCGTAMQVSKMRAAPEASKKERQKFILKDHYIVRCHYTYGGAKNLLVKWISKVPGTPPDFESEVSIHTQKLKFYPLWVGQYSADTQYVGLDDWPQFHSPAHDAPGWYEHVSYYKKEERGQILREYQIPIMGLNPDKKQEPLRDYIVTTTGKDYFDIKHVRDVNGEIIDSAFDYEEVRNRMRQKVLDLQEKEIRKEVKIIQSRNDDIREKALFYIHFPVYEVAYTYKGKGHKALIDGSNGRIIHVETPITRSFRLTTITLGTIHLAAGIIIPLLLYNTLPFLSLATSLGLIIIGILFFIVNLRGKAAEKQV
ncbi:MAG: hypothetical protein QXG44_09655 [Candidatus Jordarchaeaceae archaeon]